MRKFRNILTAAILLAMPTLLAASEGLEVPQALEKTVPLEGLTGVSLFFAQAYNGNTWLYAVYCTATMAAVGMVIALVTDLILKVIGLEVHKIEHQE